MANVTVWLFENRFPGAQQAGAGLHLRATRDALERNGLKPVEDSAIEVEYRFVNSEGFTRPDYLTFRVRVAYSHAYTGYAHDGVHLQLMAGEYDVRVGLREFNALVGAEDCLHIVGADQRPGGSDFWVKLSSYQNELASFPDDLPELRMTVLNWRPTRADEWAQD